MLLKIDDLHVSYGKIKAIKGISLEVGTGEIVTLVGANGAGKTTLLKTIPVLLVIAMEGRRRLGQLGVGCPSLRW